MRMDLVGGEKSLCLNLTLIESKRMFYGWDYMKEFLFFSPFLPEAT
jgi:hypothetical protein